jgi:hypothetical protein
MHTHRKGRHASRWDPPEPQRRYRILRVKKSKVSEKDKKLLYASLLGIGIVASTSFLFGMNSPIALGGIVVSGLMFLWICIITD